MKKILLPAVALCLSGLAFGQCDPLAHDWAGAAFGVSPDPALGETFENGQIGVAYNEVVYVLAPTNAADIDPTFEQFNVVIDSLRLDGITVFNGVSYVPLSDIGLSVTCNNNGDSPDPCIFLGGNPYCGDISGTPTVAGVFPAKIAATVYLVLFQQQQAIPYEFENYSITILDPNSVEEAPQALFAVENMPNPCDASTSIHFDLNRTEEVNLTVVNLLGAPVMQRKINGKKGSNNFLLDTSSLESGIYLYSVEAGGKKFTQRLLVQH